MFQVFSHLSTWDFKEDHNLLLGSRSKHIATPGEGFPPLRRSEFGGKWREAGYRSGFYGVDKANLMVQDTDCNWLSQVGL